LKFSGSDPYFSTFCSCAAVAWVKPPLMVKLPPGIEPLVSGAVTTFPSRTMATRSSSASSALVEAFG